MSITTAQIREHIRAFAQKSRSPHMIQDFLRLVITRVLQDKILLGLLIVGVLGIVVSGMNSQEEPPLKQQAAGTAGINETTAASRDGLTQNQDDQSTQEQNAQVDASKLKPELACEFVKWWAGSAMDYSAGSAARNHKEAFRWMTAEAAGTFQTYFWSPAISSGITSGRLIAAFQPIAVRAEAINPDGSIVVGLSGTLVLQSNGRPITEPILADFLVRQEQDGLRVIALYNKTTAYPGNTVF